MNEEFLTGALGWKGERGYSAYEIAVQNGFIGTEQDWLDTIGCPISSTINDESTNGTVSGSKAVYDFVKSEEDSYYTKTQIDTNIYTKTQIDTNIYTKSQSDTKYLAAANIIKISLTDVQLTTTGLGSSIKVDYPTGCNRSNMNLISFKIKKHDGATYDYIMFGSRRGDPSNLIPESTLTVSYQDDGMYVSGTPFWFKDDQQDIDLIFIKI